MGGPPAVEGDVALHSCKCSGFNGVMVERSQCFAMGGAARVQIRAFTMPILLPTEPLVLPMPAITTAAEPNHSATSLPSNLLNETPRQCC